MELEAAHIGGDGVGKLAVDAVAGADGDLDALVHDVHLGDDEPFRAVDHVGVAEQGEVEPAAAARAAGDGAVLLAAGAEEVRRRVVDLGGEGAFADAGDVGLCDADHGADLCGADTGSGYGAAGGGGGRGDEGVGAVVDIEQGTLGALKHHLLAVADGLVEEDGRVGDKGGKLLGGAGVVLVHLLGIEGLGAEEGVGDGVLFVAGVVDVGAEQMRVEEVHHSESRLRCILSS